MKRALTALLIFVLALLSFGGTAASIKPPSGFEGDLFQATMLLAGHLGDVNRDLCTVTVFKTIPGGYDLLGAGHCVRLNPQAVQYTVADNVDGVQSAVTVIKSELDAKYDFAIFELKTTKKYPVISLGTIAGVTIGDDVLNVNFAAALGKQLSRGHVSSDILTGKNCESCGGYFMAQVFEAGGSSGSAVVSTITHTIIGIGVVDFDGADIGMGVEPIDNLAGFLMAPVQPYVEPTPGQ